MQCLTTVSTTALADEIEALEQDYDELQSQPHRLETATRARRTGFEAATRDHPRQGELISKIGSGNASGTLGIARAILTNIRLRLAAGESSSATTNPSVGAATS